MTVDAAHKRTFAAGEWYAVVGDQVTALIPADARARVAALWDLADGGASFEEMVDGLLASGLSSLSGFALVGHGDRTRVLVRGPVTASFRTPQGDVDVVHDPDLLWADRTLDGVTGGRIGLDSGSQTDLALVNGVARASAVQFGEPATGVAETAPAEADPVEAVDRPAPVMSPAVVAPPVEAPAVEAPSVESPPVEAPSPVAAESAPFEPEVVEPTPQPEPVALPETEPMAAPIPEAIPEPDPAPAPVPVPEPEVPGGEPLSFGAPSGDDPTPTGEQPAVSDDMTFGDDIDHDGQTTVGPPVDDFLRPQVGIPGQELAPAVVAHPVAKLIFSTGDVVDVDRVILVGRAPEARRFASQDQPHLVTVSSPNHEISSTHLEIRPGAGADHGMAVVTDMGSTNGTVLVQPGLPAEDLQAGIAVSLIPGAILDLGDGVTIQTTNP